MSNIDKVRQEIDRMHQQAVLAACGNLTDWLKSRIATCVDILAFIDSLSEEPTNDIEREKMIKAVLECRLTIVRLSLNKYNPSPEQRSYLRGKADGYQQAIDLLNATDKSIGIEL